MNFECKHDHVSLHTSRQFASLWIKKIWRIFSIRVAIPYDVYKDVFLLTCWENCAKATILFLVAFIFKHRRKKNIFSVWTFSSDDFYEFSRLRLTELTSIFKGNSTLDVVKLCCFSVSRIFFALPINRFVCRVDVNHWMKWKFAIGVIIHNEVGAYW